jgi:hypothetical protein
VTAPTGAGYTYSLDEGTPQASATFSSVAVGTHDITVSNGTCTSPATTIIINAQPVTPAAPTVTLTQPTCSIATGTITVTAPTGSGITYSIDGTTYQSGVSFTSLAIGTYTVTAKNASGCISTVTSAVLNKPAKPADFAYTSDPDATTQLLSSNSFSFVAYGNITGESCNWDFGDNTTSTQVNPTKSYTKIGIYNARLIVTNTLNCSDTSYQTVVVTPASKALDTIPVCSSSAPLTVTQTIVFPRSTTDWASTNLKIQNAAKFDTTLGTLLAVKIINNGSFTTHNKVEITGNMAAGTKRLVKIEVDGKMNFSGPGFEYGIIPPTILDTFSSTGFDGIKDFAGTSGKDFGPHTSSMKDSTIFNSPLLLTAYIGSDSVKLTAYTNTNSSASFPTGNDTASISTTATDTATIIYYYCPTANIVSGGEGGGLESKNIGTAIANRVYNKAINNVPKLVDYATKAVPVDNRTRMITMGSGANGSLTLSDILPQQLNNFSLKAYITTPIDIPSITNATDVLSIDYTLNSQAKAVSFGTQTKGQVYDHTKAICDRLKGSELTGMQTAMVNNVKMVTYVLKTAEGNTEYAMSFAVGAKTGRNYYTIQSNWLNKDYTLEETMYNIQLWAVSPDMVTDMATKIMTNLQANLPVQYLNDNTVLPDTYITAGNRTTTNLNLTIANNVSATSGYFTMEDLSTEISTTTTKRTIPFTLQPNGKTSVSIPMSDTYASTISMYVNNKLLDVVYMADGTWSYGTGTASTVTSFKVTNDSVGKVYPADELPIFRNVQITGNCPDYVSIFKLLKGGGIAQDLSAYKTLKFTAGGGYNLRVTFIKSSIVNYKDQYNTVIPLSNDAKDYYLSLNSLASTASSDKINLSDVTTIVFSIETGSGQSSVLNTSLSKISFTKQTTDYIQSLTAREVQLYPNPAKSKFTCSFMSDKDRVLTLKVIDLATGRTIHTQQVNAITGANIVTVDLNKGFGGNSLNVIALDGADVQYKRTKIVVDNK